VFIPTFSICLSPPPPVRRYNHFSFRLAVGCLSCTERVGKEVNLKIMKPLSRSSLLSAGGCVFAMIDTKIGEPFRS
jgi:hypothetical protein